MNKNSIRKLRLQLVEELKGYKGEPVKLDLPKKLLEEILFDHHSGKIEGDWKDFADELNNDYLPCDILHKIDYTGVSFKNFRCFNIGHGFKGITINPQEVYKKDLSSAKLDGVIFDLDERGFDGVHLFDTDFKGARVKDGSLIRINPQKLDGISMGGCIFDGVVFNGSFDNAHISGADFRGSYNAVIDPQTIRNKNFFGTKLGNVKFINNFMGACVDNADFTGSYEAVIDPQTIYRKCLIGTKLTDAYIVGKNMDGVTLRNTDFTGAKGIVLINPQTVSDRCLSWCHLSGVNITGPLDKCLLLGTDFTGSRGGYFDSEFANIDKNTNFANVVDMHCVQAEEKELNRAKTLIKKSIYSF